MSTQYSSSGNPKIFAIIGLIFAIFSFLFSIIPCVGFYAIGPSLMALAFCGVSFAGLKQRNQSTSIPLAGLIVGGIAITIGIYQYYNYKTVFDTKAEIENSINSAQQQVIDTVEKKALKHVEQKLQEEIDKDSIEKIKNDSVQK
ncbi:hypothetical protein GKZ90_0009150 [Flavobacterium sp. MC2016-06]|uniref:hypothetical protein n=1 Tax=Flavobacterium sp. MC2016-06 TaxID=2676308 RepID=UPI0012BADA1D|nr:hypothetical protein [Flavobacterium sp. MC2016-06]MBU3859369.1 hypothetical protein [Flavobacterium sp. MC2016-06]